MPLVEKLKANSSGWVANALASIGDFRATPFFIQSISSPIYSLPWRGNLLWQLGVLGGPGAADTLMNILDDPNQSDIQWQAVAGMRALTDRTSIPALEQAVKNRKGRSLQEALAALHRLQAVEKPGTSVPTKWGRAQLWWHTGGNKIGTPVRPWINTVIASS